MLTPGTPSTPVKGRRNNGSELQQQKAAYSRLDFADGMRGFWRGPVEPELFTEKMLPRGSMSGTEEVPEVDFMGLQNAGNEKEMYRPLVRVAFVILCHMR